MTTDSESNNQMTVTTRGSLTTQQMLDWLKEHAPGEWWYAVEDRIGTDDADYHDLVAARYRVARESSSAPR